MILSMPPIGCLRCLGRPGSRLWKPQSRFTRQVTRQVGPRRHPRAGRAGQEGGPPQPAALPLHDARGQQGTAGDRPADYAPQRHQAHRRGLYRRGSAPPPRRDAGAAEPEQPGEQCCSRNVERQSTMSVNEHSLFSINRSAWGAELRSIGLDALRSSEEVLGNRARRRNCCESNSRHHQNLVVAKNRRCLQLPRATSHRW